MKLGKSGNFNADVGSKYQRGLTMIETLIAIAIGLMVLAVVAVLVSKATASNALTTAEQDLSSIRMDIRHLYSGQPDYSGLTNTVADSAGVFPSTMKKTGGIKNVWDGTVTVAPNTANATQFTIAYAGVGKDNCVKLASYGYGSWVKLSINGTSLPQTGGGAITKAATACGASNTLFWTSN